MQQQPHPMHKLPNAAAFAGMTMDGLLDATQRMCEILSEESEHLAAMRIEPLAKLNQEKTKLTKQLETYQMLMASDPQFVLRADEKTREELLLLVDDLAVVTEENFRRTATARAVNQRVMQAIMDVVSENHRPATYGRSGQTASSADLTMSINLNQQA